MAEAQELKVRASASPKNERFLRRALVKGGVLVGYEPKKGYLGLAASPE